MKQPSITFMIVIATACLTLLFPGASVFAQSTEQQFKVGDRINADMYPFGQPKDPGLSASDAPRAWRKAMITRVFEAENGGGGNRTDAVIIALADAVMSRGSDDKIEAS